MGTVVAKVKTLFTEADLLVKKISDVVHKQVEDAVKKIVMSFLENRDIANLTTSIRDTMLPLSASIAETALNSYAPTLDLQDKQGFEGKGTRKRKLQTTLGEIDYERRAFYNRDSGTMVFPADLEFGIIPGMLQNDVRTAITKLALEMPFMEAKKFYESLTGNKISEGAIHKTVADIGADAVFADVIPDKEELENKIEALKKHSSEGSLHIVIGVDGAHEPLRAEDSHRQGDRGPGFWKECKGFRAYAVVGEDIVEQLASWHQISDDEALGEQLSNLAALLKDIKDPIVTIGDGAKWIWNQYSKTLPRGIGILDWYHCVEHLAKFSTVQYGTGSTRGEAWLQEAKNRLMENNAQGIIHGLSRISYNSELAKEEAEKLIEYLTNNIGRINYGEYREQGLTIGSGGMESANKFVSHVRLKRSGCWWKQSHANEILKLRCAKVNETLSKVFAKEKAEKLNKQKIALDSSKSKSTTNTKSIQKKSALALISGGRSKN